MLDDAWDGSLGAAEAQFRKGGGAFPAVRPLNAARYPLLARAHAAARVSVELEAGDLIFVPAGLPHWVSTATPSVATSINIVDATNWAGVREMLSAGPDADEALLERIDAVHREQPVRFQGHVPFVEWGSWLGRLTLVFYCRRRCGCMSHFLMRPRRAAATRTNAAIDASRRGANVHF